MIKVNSDIGRLRRVLVHRPGLEIDWMVPRMMEELLFDDILYGEQARREHGRFCRVMQSAGVEVLDAGTLLAGSCAGRTDSDIWVTVTVHVSQRDGGQSRERSVTNPVSCPGGFRLRGRLAAAEDEDLSLTGHVTAGSGARIRRAGSRMLCQPAVMAGGADQQIVNAVIVHVAGTIHAPAEP